MAVWFRTEIKLHQVLNGWRDDGGGEELAGASVGHECHPLLATASRDGAEELHGSCCYV